MFDARRAVEAAEAKYKPWPFVGLDGKTYELPHMLMVDAGLQRQVQAGEIDQDQFLQAVAPDAWAAIQEMPVGVQLELVREWQGEAKAEVDELGKELSPPSAPNRAARRSKPTSPPAAGTSGPSSSGKSRAGSKSSGTTRQAS